MCKFCNTRIRSEIPVCAQKYQYKFRNTSTRSVIFVYLRVPPNKCKLRSISISSVIPTGVPTENKSVISISPA